MEENRYKLDRPIRVVVFGGGPVLEKSVKQFICMLEDHPEIDFLACFCQSENQSISGIVGDLWRRRRFLAFPLLVMQAIEFAVRFLATPRVEMELNRKLARLSNRIHYVLDIHAGSVLAQVGILAPDLGLIYSSPILKPALFEIPTFGTLGIHHGKLPEYRGKKTTFWAIYRGERSAGVTIQKVNAGLDTGEIVKQGEVPIGRRLPWVIWRELDGLGRELYIQAILEVRDGKASYQKPVGQKGQLYRDPKLIDILTLWWRRIAR